MSFALLGKKAYEKSLIMLFGYSIIIETDILCSTTGADLSKENINRVRLNCLVNIIEDNDKIKLIATNLLETLDDAELEFGIEKLIVANKILLKK